MARSAAAPSFFDMYSLSAEQPIIGHGIQQTVRSRLAVASPVPRTSIDDDLLAEDLTQRAGELDAPDLCAAPGRAPADEAVGAHQHGALAADAAELRPGEPRIEEVAVELADPTAQSSGEPLAEAMRLAAAHQSSPVFAGDQQEAARPRRDP